MGLEMVQIWMAVEENYGLELATEEAAQCSTFGQLVDTVHMRIGSVENLSPKELSLKRLRLLLSSEFGIPPEKLTPDATLDSLNAGLSEVLFWERLMKRLGHEPDAVIRATLRKPRWFWAAVLCAYALLVLAQTCLFPDIPGTGGTFWVALFLSAIEVTLIFRFIRPHLRENRWIEVKYRTISDLIPLVGSNRDHGIPREQLARELRALVAKELGLREDQIREHSHFVNDLGCG